MDDSYGRVARIYDLLAESYSLGAIRRTKRAHLASLQPNQRVLYAGAGTCQEAQGALAIGADITLVDTAEEMLERARQRLGADAKRIGFRTQSVFDLPRVRLYDHVIAPFFLNVFAATEVAGRLDQLVQLVRPGGSITIADFRGPQSGALGALQRLYYQPPLWLFHLLTHTPLHPLYDYRTVAAHCQSKLQETHRSVHRVLGLPLFESLTFRVEG